ncbi:MAG: flotillin-like FloA family protein [Bacteroidales bacterium]|nr:flotillin-like FloA family protein [Bacteroidales bacterium]
MEDVWVIVVAFVVVVAIIIVIAVFTHVGSQKKEPTPTKTLKMLGIKLNRKRKVAFKKKSLESQKRILSIIYRGYNVLSDYGEEETDSLMSEFLEMITRNQRMHIYDTAKRIEESEVPDVNEFLHAFKTIKVADPTFMLERLIDFAHVKNIDLDAFARAWCDQKNAELNIDIDTAYNFVSDGRDFTNLVNHDIIAKRAGIDLDEKDFINDIDDNGITVVIYSIIRANYEGIYLSEEDSLRVNKANVLEYGDTFMITLKLLVNLYNIGRDVKRFTDVMIRAHHSGVRISFSLADLYSLTDDEFENLVNNVIRASDVGINIDQKDLIRQNIQGTDITKLITALIKAQQYKIDVTPDELMSYFVNKKADVEKFVEALNFIKVNKLDLSKDFIVDISKPDRNVFDYVQAYKICKEYESKPDNYGITVKDIKAHFLKTGKVLKTVKTVIKAQEQLGLKMNFGIANKILTKTDGTLKEAIEWAQNPRVEEVTPSVTCVCKNGVQLTPKINVTVRGEMDQFFWGYKIDVLFKRINEAVIFEFESAPDHVHILQTLPEISHNVLRRINEEENKKEIKTVNTTESELNEHSSHQLLDVNIYDVVIGQNVKEELELRQAQIESEKRRLQAEADRAKAEADIRIAMVQQFHDGIKPNFNELHKANLLAASAEDITTGYERPQ